MKALILAAALALVGCSTPQAAPDPTLTAAGQIVLRAAIRHGVSDYIDKHGVKQAVQVKAVADDILAVLNSDTSTTLAALKELAYSKIPPTFSPLDQQDAHDLIDLVALAVQQYVGTGQLDPRAVVDLRDVLGTISFLAGQYAAG